MSEAKPQVQADQKAFEALAFEHLDVLYRHAFMLTRHTSDAQDLVQEAYLKAFRSFHRFEQGTNLKAWLFTILRNTFFNLYRKRKSEPNSVSLDEDSNFSFYAEAHQAAAKTSEKAVPMQSLNDWKFETVFGDEIHNAVDTLADEFREVIFLCDVQEMSYADIATILEIPIGTVRSRIARARAMLQKVLWRYAEEKGILRREST